MQVTLANTPEAARANMEALAANSQLGGGMAIGLNLSGDTAMQVYWAIDAAGRSAGGSLREVGEGVRYEPGSTDYESDDRLPGYDVMMLSGGLHLVANNSHLPDVIEGYNRRQRLHETLMDRMMRQESPPATPLLTGQVHPYPHSNVNIAFATYALHQIRKTDSSDYPSYGHYTGYLTPQDNKGVGKGVHTSLDVQAVPATFDVPPYSLPFGKRVEDTAEMYWAHLDRNNRLAIAVKGVHLVTGAISYRIINRDVGERKA